MARSQPGLVSIAGGKYTTYRVMAADAVDMAREDLPGQVPGSVTADIPLVGAEGYQALVHQVPQLARRTGLPEWRVRRLLDRYGSLVQELFEVADAQPDLWEPLAGAPEYLRAEIRYAVTHEGARHLDDVLARRTRASIEAWDRGVAAAPVVAELMAPGLGWTQEQIDREVSHYLKRVEAERASQTQPDDATADAARLGAEDIVPVG